MLHPRGGELRFTMTELVVKAYPDLVMFVETPADELTREKLPLTR